MESYKHTINTIQTIHKRCNYTQTSEVSGTGQPEVSPTLLSFQPEHFFALGSPLGLFLTVRGVHSLDKEYSLPTCKRFYNIFHPVSQVAITQVTGSKYTNYHTYSISSKHL